MREMAYMIGLFLTLCSFSRSIALNGDGQKFSKPTPCGADIQKLRRHPLFTEQGELLRLAWVAEETKVGNRIDPSYKTDISRNHFYEGNSSENFAVACAYAAVLFQFPSHTILLNPTSLERGRFQVASLGFLSSVQFQIILHPDLHSSLNEGEWNELQEWLTLLPRTYPKSVFIVYAPDSD